MLALLARKLAVCAISTGLACMMCSGVAAVFDYDPIEAAEGAAIGTPIITAALLLFLARVDDILLYIVVVCLGILFGSPIGMAILHGYASADVWMISILGTMLLVLAVMISSVLVLACACFVKCFKGEEM